MAENDEDQAACGHGFGDPLRQASANVLRGLNGGQLEHGVRQHGTGTAADDLDQGVCASFTPGHRSSYRLDQGHGRIEVRATDRPEQRDQDHQHRDSCSGVREQRNRGVSPPRVAQP